VAPLGTVNNEINQPQYRYAEKVGVCDRLEPIVGAETEFSANRLR
jgi:hypothetical protein